MSEDNETQLVEKQKSRYFSLLMAESTPRFSEVILLAYARYIDKGEFADKMIFRISLQNTISTADVHSTLNNYLYIIK